MAQDNGNIQFMLSTIENGCWKGIKDFRWVTTLLIVYLIHLGEVSNQLRDIFRDTGFFVQCVWETESLSWAKIIPFLESQEMQW